MQGDVDLKTILKQISQKKEGIQKSHISYFMRATLQKKKKKIHGTWIAVVQTT